MKVSAPGSPHSTRYISQSPCPRISSKPREQAQLRFPYSVSLRNSVLLPRVLRPGIPVLLASCSHHPWDCCLRKSFYTTSRKRVTWQTSTATDSIHCNSKDGDQSWLDLLASTIHLLFSGFRRGSSTLLRPRSSRL